MNSSTNFLARIGLLSAALSILDFRVEAVERYREPFRPQFHFTPERNWMNDPNGMVFYEGEWHLFYQYNPKGDTWGHMSWGHAVSRDLVSWEHLPVAIPEKDGIMIFSGSAVVDWNNTSGFGKDGKPPLVAIYTGHRPDLQDQRIAYSNDRGRTWTNYERNPVLDEGMSDFRDPKVCWHEPTQQWVMVIAVPKEKKVRFYRSSDLKAWKQSGEFGPAGGVDGIWECPDLFPLPVEGECGTQKWVLIVSLNPGGPAGGSACQYFVGEFDGNRFVADPREKNSEFVPQGRVLADFEGGNYNGWNAEGDAFGPGPANGTLSSQQPVSGFRGAGLVNTYRDGDRSQGTLTSPPFELSNDFLSFLIGGGAHAGETCMNLLIEDKVVRTATGSERERLAWKSWDVREYRGKKAVLQIVDRHTGGWGHINVDHIILANEPARPAADDALWADYGADFYAAVSWSDVPKSDGRRIWLGWMTGVQYAGKVPTSPWRSAMTVPRTLTLRRTPAGFRLVQTPVAELQKLRVAKPLRFPGGSMVDAAKWLSSQPELPPLLEVTMTFAKAKGSAPFTIGLHTAPNEVTTIHCDPINQLLRFDRTRSGETGFDKAFPAKHEAPVRINDDALSVRLLLDTSSLEIFAQDGETVLTELIFPTAGSRRLSLEGTGQTPLVSEITIQPLEAAPVPRQALGN